jgi:hypothetical protein
MARLPELKNPKAGAEVDSPVDPKKALVDPQKAAVDPQKKEIEVAGLNASFIMKFRL